MRGHASGRAWRPVDVALLGSAGVVVVGSPYLGADSAGAIALAVGACVAVSMATGAWLTVSRVTAAAASGLVLVICFAALGAGGRSTGPGRGAGRAEPYP